MFDHAPGTVKRARKQRRDMSLPEVLLWRLLKTKPMGVKFRNHHPLGDFVVDFFCHSARTAFEIDGISHDMGDQSEFDAQRSASIKSLGYKVVRIPASDVLKDAKAIADSMIRYCLAQRESAGADR